MKNRLHFVNMLLKVVSGLIFFSVIWAAEVNADEDKKSCNVNNGEICKFYDSGAEHSSDPVSIKINVSAEIYVTPCKINGNSGIDVIFPKIPLQKVDGENYAIPTSVTIDCGQTYDGGAYYIYMSSVNPVHGENNNIIQTKEEQNSSVLGIALYQGDGTSIPLPLGEGDLGIYGRKMDVSALKDDVFTFTAVPYKYNDSHELVAADFSASATMSIYYL